MSGLTAKACVSTCSLESYVNDHESLSCQLDRLNKVVQSIALEELSPEIHFNCGSSELDSYIDYSKISLFEPGDLVVESSCDLDSFSGDFERLSMQIEDYRSHEARSSFKSSQNSKILFELNSADLEKLSHDIDNIRFAASSSKIENIINICGKQLIFIVKNRQPSYANKLLICNNLRATNNKLKNAKDFEIESYKNDLEAYMAESYKDSFNLVNIEPNQLLINNTRCEVFNSNKIKEEQQKIIQQLEFNCAEVNMLKEYYEKRIIKLHDLEKHLNEKIAAINQETTRMQTDKIILAKDQEIIDQQKKVISQIKEDNRKKLEIVKNTLSDVRKNANFIIKPCIKKPSLEKKKSEEAIVLKPRRNEHKCEIDLEIQQLSQEIKNLENSLPGNPKNSDYIQTRIDRLKTRESNLKSKRVINASLERSNSVTSKITYFERERTFSSIISHSKPSTESTSALLTSNQYNISKKPPINSPNKSAERPLQKPDEMQKYLKMRESRLVEKEEELSKRENMLINNLAKHPDNYGLLSILQSEQRNLKILRTDLEKRQRNLEQEVLAQSRRCSEMKAKEREVLDAIESFDAFSFQKKHVEERLQFLLSVFEDAFSSCGGI